MHIAFLNPQGNFDAADSYLTEHPDFGGQLVYVKEVAIAMAEAGHRVDIVTRQIEDADWPEFSDPVAFYAGYVENPRILRIPCGGPEFLNKERLWPHLEAFAANLIAFYGDDGLPDAATGHYADGGYCCAVLGNRCGIPFTFTGHSLGAQKLDKLGMNLANMTEMEARFHFAQRIDAERLSMARAGRIVTSTNQERTEQYTHVLYRGIENLKRADKFQVIPPGVNMRVFSNEPGPDDDKIARMIDARSGGRGGPAVVVSSRLDEKKNIAGVVKAFAGCEPLRERASLALCIRGIEDPRVPSADLSEAERAVLDEINAIIDSSGIASSVDFLDLRSQLELAAAYRVFAARGSVFALTSFYEPFGLAPIEAAACGLACAATRNGGPTEIFEGGSGVLVDPFDADDIAVGLLDAFDRQTDLARRARARVLEKYTWDKTAEAYVDTIRGMIGGTTSAGEPLPTLDASDRMAAYLRERD